MLLIPLVVFRVPYYSWIVTLTFVIYAVLLIREIIRARRGPTFDSPGLIMMLAFYGIFMVPYALIDEGYLNLSLIFVLVIPNSLNIIAIAAVLNS